MSYEMAATTKGAAAAASAPASLRLYKYNAVAADDEADAAEPPSIPSRSQDRHRTANDVRVGPASPVVLTSILSSFSTHPAALADIYSEGNNRPSSFYQSQLPKVPPPPPRSSQPRSPTVDIFTPPDSAIPSRSAAAPAQHVYNGSVVAATGEDQEDDQAAEAPVVPTSRRPSNLERQKSLSQRMPKFHLPLRTPTVAFQLNGGASSISSDETSYNQSDEAAPAPHVASVRSARSGQDSQPARTFSLTSRSSARPSYTDMRRGGPPSAYPSKPSRSMRNGSLTSGRVFSQFGTPSVASPQSTSQVSRRASFDEDEEYVDSGPARYPRGAERPSGLQSTAGVPDRVFSSSDSAHGASPAKAPATEDKSTRNSSTRHKDRSNLLSRARNAISERTSREHIADQKPRSKSRVFVTPDDDDHEEAAAHEDDVMRRIRELTAAAKERKRLEMSNEQSAARLLVSTDASAADAFVQTAPRSGEAPATPGRKIPPPITTDVKKQAELAKRMEETRVIASNGHDVQQPVTPPPIPMKLPNGDDAESIARNKPFRAMSLRAVSLKGLSSRPSLDAPASIRAKTPSKSPSSSRPGSRSQRHPRNHSPPATGRNSTSQQNRYSTLIEESASIDSVFEAVDDFLQAPRLSQKIKVTGRQVAFSEVGDPHGHVVFCCIGMGVTRFITSFYDDLALSLGLRLITLDRPGVGDSEPYYDGYRPPLSWPDDLDAVCGQLNISSFSILAHSAGTVYALATAIRFRERINGRIHLLAPWIPPSQLTNIGLSESSRSGHLPRSQRLLRLLPSSFLKLTNTLNIAGNPKSNSSIKSASNSKASRKSTDTGISGLPTAAASVSSFVSPRPSMMGRSGNGNGNGGGGGGSRAPSVPQSPNIAQTGFPAAAAAAAPAPPPAGEASTHAASAAAATTTARPRRRGPAAPSALFGRSRNNTRPSTPRLDDTTPMPASEANGHGQHAHTNNCNYYNGGGESAIPSAAPSVPASPGRSSFFSRDSDRGGERDRSDPLELTRRYDAVLTPAIWKAANRNANPQIDLLVCLERKQPIGFRYADVDAGKGIIIHHGSKDSRIPLENVKWIGKVMRRVEVRVVEGEGHSLMANAGVMGAVLTEMSADLDGAAAAGAFGGLLARAVTVGGDVPGAASAAAAAAAAAVGGGSSPFGNDTGLGINVAHHGAASVNNGSSSAAASAAAASSGRAGRSRRGSITDLLRGRTSNKA